ncbi:hypothetical protein PM082_016013 [Marasmius tenuissimus]|nr:hypothetical protein PM082_016013 [Marasmius tenuissimus]
MSFLFSKSKSEKRSSDPEKGPASTATNALAAISGVPAPVLETLQDVARLAPAPYLSIICSVALWILEAVQTFKENKEAYKGLGEDTCGVVYAINDTCQESMKENTTWTTELEEKLSKIWVSIKQIQSFIGGQLRRSGSSRRLLTYKSDFERIQRHRDSSLKDCLNIFRLSSNIAVRELVRGISEKQQADPSGHNSV